jgi:hypothetical protein
MTEQRIKSGCNNPRDIGGAALVTGSGGERLNLALVSLCNLANKAKKALIFNRLVI